MSAQQAMIAAINADAENVIAKAIAFRPSIASIVAETRKAQGPISGVAAVACRYALKGADAAETMANMDAFVATL